MDTYRGGFIDRHSDGDDLPGYDYGEDEMAQEPPPSPVGQDERGAGHRIGGGGSISGRAGRRHPGILAEPTSAPQVPVPPSAVPTRTVPSRMLRHRARSGGSRAGTAPVSTGGALR